MFLISPMKKYIIITKKIDLKISQWSCNLSVASFCHPSSVRSHRAVHPAGPTEGSVSDQRRRTQKTKVGDPWYIQTRESRLHRAS